MCSAALLNEKVLFSMADDLNASWHKGIIKDTKIFSLMQIYIENNY
jgi:hypothetical protein